MKNVSDFISEIISAHVLHHRIVIIIISAATGQNLPTWSVSQQVHWRLVDVLKEGGKKFTSNSEPQMVSSALGRGESI